MVLFIAFIFHHMYILVLYTKWLDILPLMAVIPVHSNVLVTCERSHSLKRNHRIRDQRFVEDLVCTQNPLMKIRNVHKILRCLSYCVNFTHFLKWNNMMSESRYEIRSKFPNANVQVMIENHGYCNNRRRSHYAFLHSLFVFMLWKQIVRFGVVYSKQTNNIDKHYFIDTEYS